MIFGIPLEIQNDEGRVGASPALVESLVHEKHQVMVETRAGEASQISDEDYEAVGGIIVPSPEKLYGQSEAILKVMAPRPIEYELIKPHHTIFAYFHFMTNLEMARSLVARGCNCFSYNAVTNSNHLKPLLNFELELTGKLAIQQAMHYSQTSYGGRGVFLGDIPGGKPAVVTVVGANAAAISAASYAAEHSAEVTLLDTHQASLERLHFMLDERVEVLTYKEDYLEDLFPGTDVLISAPGLIGEDVDPLIKKHSIGWLPPGSVIMDLDLAYGGSVETSKRTDQHNPVFADDRGVLHFGLSNLPGYVPATASPALSACIAPFIQKIAGMGVWEAFQSDPRIASGISIFEGRITRQDLADTLGMSMFNPGTSDVTAT